LVSFWPARTNTGAGFNRVYQGNQSKKGRRFLIRSDQW